MKRLYQWSIRQKSLAIIIFLVVAAVIFILSLSMADADCGGFFVGDTTIEEARSELLYCAYDLVYCGEMNGLKVYGVRNSNRKYVTYLLFFKNKLVSTQTQLINSEGLENHMKEIDKGKTGVFTSEQFITLASVRKVGKDGKRVYTYIITERPSAQRIFYVKTDVEFLRKIWCPQTKRKLWQPPLYLK